MKIRRTQTKKMMWIAVIAVIVVNFLFPLTPGSNKESRLSLAVLTARADNSGESDIPDPGDEIIPFRQVPKEKTLSALINYLFK